MDSGAMTRRGMAGRQSIVSLWHRFGLILYSDSAPEASGDSAPEGREKAVSPVDDPDVAMAVDGLDNLPGHSFWLEHHGVVEITIEQGCVYKTRADVGEVNP